MPGTETFLLLHPGDPWAGAWGRRLELKPHMVYLYSLLREHFEVSVLDLDTELERPTNAAEHERFRVATVERVLAFETDILGISCWSSLSYLSARHIAEEVRRRRPSTRIVVGGYHPTLVPEDFTEPGSPFDHVVRGEVGSLLAALGRMAGARDTLAVRPDYRAYPYFRSHQAAGVYLSLGCPYSCSFCMEYARTWRPLPVDDAVALVTDLARRDGFEYVMLFDACFGLDRRWRRAFLSGLVEAAVPCWLWLETRVDLLDDEDLDLLARLRVKVDLGVDSFSPAMLEIMGKTRDPEAYLGRFLQISERCNALGILHDAFLIFNHPGETAATLAQTMDFIRRRVEPSLVGGHLRLRGQSFAIFPGSHVAEHLEEYRRTYGTRVLVPDWWRRQGDHAALARYVIPSLDADQRPFTADLAPVEETLSAFNARSRDADTWKRLAAFGGADPLTPA